MSDHAILRAYFEELLERLGDGDHVLGVVGSPAVEQLNHVAGSLGFQPPIVLRYLKRRPGQGQFWKVSDPATSEISDANDYDAIVADIIDPFSNEEVRRIVIAAGHQKVCEANPDARADLKALLRRWVKFLGSAADTAQPAPVVTAAAQPSAADPAYTLGDLIRDLEGSDQAYAQNKAVADRKAAAGYLDAQWWYVQAAVLRWQPDPNRMPGIEQIELLCNEESGSGITVECARRLRARVCRQAGILPADADKLHLNTVADLIGAASKARSHSDPAAIPSSWTDPSKCPKCGTAAPDWVQFARQYDCRTCGWKLITGKMMLPVGKVGAPPEVVQSHGPYWEPPQSPHLRPQNTAAAPTPTPPSSVAELADQASNWIRNLLENRDTSDADRLSRLPRFNLLWEDMHRLGVRDFPSFPGEPATVAHALDMLRSVMRLCQTTHEWPRQINDAMDDTLAGRKEGDYSAIGAGDRQAGNREPISPSDLPTLLSAADLAKATGLNKAALDTALRRYAKDHRDCRNEQENPRRNEPAYLYRVADVWAVVQKLLVKGR